MTLQGAFNGDHDDMATTLHQRHFHKTLTRKELQKHIHTSCFGKTFCVVDMTFTSSPNDEDKATPPVS